MSERTIVAKREGEMEISSANQSTPSGQVDQSTDGINARIASGSSQVPGASSDKVTISAAALSAQQKNANPAAGNKTASSTDSKEEPSTAKSLVYGSLRLDRPKPEAESKPADSYDYGRWLAVAVTVGAIVSVFV